MGKLHQLLLDLGRLSGEIRQSSNVPIPEQRLEDSVVVDAQVVNAGLGDLDGATEKAGNDGTRHLKAGESLVYPFQRQ